MEELYGKTRLDWEKVTSTGALLPGVTGSERCLL